MPHRDVAITRISPVSALRVALALSLVGLVAWIICVTVLYFGLSAAGIVEKLNSVIGGVGSDQVVSYGMVLSITALMGVVTAILLTVLAPITALIYNAIVDLFGGLVVEADSEYE